MNKRRRYKAKARRRTKPAVPQLVFHRKVFEFVWPMVPAPPLTVDVVYGVGYFRKS